MKWKTPRKENPLISEVWFSIDGGGAGEGRGSGNGAREAGRYNHFSVEFSDSNRAARPTNPNPRVSVRAASRGLASTREITDAIARIDDSGDRHRNNIEFYERAAMSIAGYAGRYIYLIARSRGLVKAALPAPVTTPSALLLIFNQSRWRRGEGEWIARPEGSERRMSRQITRQDLLSSDGRAPKERKSQQRQRERRRHREEQG